MSQDQIKMLSIDDRMLTSDLDRAGYRNMGITVRQVSTFAEAQDLIHTEDIHIIVINMDFERVDAMATCKHFKSSEETSHIPIVITSVQTSAGIRKSALAAGADLFVEQPLPRQYFIEKLKKLLDQVTRGDDRIGIQEHVSITFDNNTMQLPIGDISSTGMLVNSDNITFPEGAVVQLSFLIPAYKKPIVCSGTVVRNITAEGNAVAKVAGIGIRFEKFDGDSEKRLEKYVAKTSDQDGKMIYYL